ncbi:MAG: ABC transporter permease [Rhodospirillales bacterium]|nr:ABC transporter permease [Rhodospirillales bacterium]
MPIISLAFKSMFNRRVTVLLTVFAIALSVALLLGVEKVRTEAKGSFANTVSGTDLIVGARSGAIQLLLYSVFRIGNATNNISIESYRKVAARPNVAWTIPLSLGDSHRGFRVLGTNQDYFKHYRYGRKRPLAFAQGVPFADLFDVVLGADVAHSLGYRLDDAIVVNHGLGREGFSKHQDKPFRVSGILAKTGTPVDRTVHVSLEAIEGIHVDWKSGTRIPGMTVDADKVRQMKLKPKAITAFMVGLKSRFSTFSEQRFVNTYRGEPLLAILPGVALQELWSLLGTAETALSVISFFVVLTGLIGMLVMLLASLNERRREMAILRSVGARPYQVFGLFVAEALIMTGLGCLFGVILLNLSLVLAQPIIDARFGLFISIDLPSVRNLIILGLVIVAGFIAGAIPAYRAYRQSLADGMIVHT